ncbi:MAG: GNAT family protein [Hyphomicrobium sp.]|nr:GNAT family protein [Hyphomicrobium sp.]
MVFLRSTTVPDVPNSMAGQHVVLRAPQVSDYGAWAELRTMSRQHLTPWEPAWPRDDLTKAAFKRRVRHYQREVRNDLGYAFLIIRSADERLAGGIALSGVERGVAQKATLGYWLGTPFVGQGLMADAVRTILAFSFGPLRLHRIEAATQPDNARSIHVLERTGFQREGYARDYLKINGAWRDHVLFARLAPTPAEGGR